MTPSADNHESRIAALEKRLASLSTFSVPNQQLSTTNSPKFLALYLGNQTNASLIQVDINALANNGIAQIDFAAGAIALAFIINASDGTFAIYTLQGGVHATQEISDPSAKFTNAAGGAASVNIYWSVGNAQYELENKLGSAKNFRVLLFRNG